jgi:ATP-dependent DNA helicase PIF1
VADSTPPSDLADPLPADPAPLATPPLPPDAFLDQIELSTGHFQRGQGVDEAALAGAVADLPLSDLLLVDPNCPTPCAFITGRAGVGKSTILRERCAADPRYAVLAASTGIAAINLGTVTIHSLLGFFDTDSLRDAYIKGQAQRRLTRLADEGYRNVVVDECSMISKDVLDVLVRVFDDVNGRRLEKGDRAVGLILCGDGCQLPAIPDRPAGYHPTPGRRRVAIPTPWFFDSVFWPRFACNTTHLTKVWRQADPRFLAALAFARAGRGRDCLQVLQSAGQRFEQGVDMQFEGTTVVGKNDEVDRINQIRLDREKGRPISLPSRRWAAGGRVRPEWKNVPERTILREGCYVMILANQYDEGRMIYANGDCGWVRGIQVSKDRLLPPTVMVELVRTGEVVHVSSLVRDISYGDQPGWVGAEWGEQGKDEDGKFLPRPHLRKRKGRWVVGQLEYFPLRLAYSSTCHKVQGLSLDRVQLDFRTWNWKTPGMVYVGLSRARSLAGLRLVGTGELLMDRCKVDAKVVRWL